MFLDITEFVKDPKYFPVVVVQPNGKDFIVGMDCDGEYSFKCVEKAVYEDVDLFKDFIMRMYYTLEGKLNRNTLKGKKGDGFVTSDDKELQEQVQDEIQEFIPEYNPEDFEGLNLSPQEIYFAYLNVKHNDAVRAYQEAFGVPYKTALAKGKRLAKTPKIKEATMILYDEIWQEAMAVLPIRLMRDLENIRSLNIASYMHGSRFKLPEELTEEQQLMIEEVQYQTNNKTGETILLYKFPNKGSVYSKYMELIKMQKETSKDKESTSTDREAADMIQAIFKNIGASNENK